MKKKKVPIIIVAIILLLIVVLFCILSGTKSNKTVVTKEQQMAFNALGDMANTWSNQKYDSKEAQKEAFTSGINSWSVDYGNVPGVSSTAVELVNDVAENKEFSSIYEKIQKMTDKVEKAEVTEVESESTLINLADTSRVNLNEVKMKSSSVCEFTSNDPDYCVNLAAKVYVSNPKSSKWAVILHGVTMNGIAMYNSVGDMYTTNGFNVLAIDSRGFGNSEGEVAMGFLESLDAIDWIVDLNQNYARYGVNVAPDSIIIHGVSLGGATTLQISTNPNVSLDKLHVKGVVDDCGYTSMVGIIKSLFLNDNLSTMLPTLDIDGLAFKGTLKDILTGLNIDTSQVDGLLSGRISISSFTDYVTKNNPTLGNNFGEVMSYLTKIDSSKYSVEDITALIKGYNSSNSKDFNSYLNGFDASTIVGNNPSVNIDDIKDLVGDLGSASSKYNYNQGSGFGNNSWSNNNSISDSFDWSNVWSNYTNNNSGYKFGTTSTSKAKAELMVDSTSSNELVDSVIVLAITKLLKSGLTSENFYQYQDSFGNGRSFPSYLKVLVIHGTSDMMVPYSNAETVASKAGNNLVYKWAVEGQNHAFITMGTNKKAYTKLIKEFSACVNGGSCSISEPDLSKEDTSITGAASGLFRLFKDIITG